MPRIPFNSSLVGVNVVTAYLPSHSRPDDSQYTFAYTVTISNGSNLPVQLLSRHWIITDADNEVQEVRGEGVVGKQPKIGPGETFTYTSGCPLPTSQGIMSGHYRMATDDGETFEVKVPAFSLDIPGMRRIIN